MISNKHPNNQIKGIGQSIFELKFCKKKVEKQHSSSMLPSIVFHAI